MTRRTQGLLLGFVGALLLRLSLSGAYLRYVAEWMKWPVAASGLLLVLLAIGPVLDDGDDDGAGDGEHGGHDHAGGHGGPPRVTWLLVLPGLVAFMIAPPALGSYLAERRADEAVALAPAVVAPIAGGAVVPLEVQEFVWRAQDGGESLAGRTVALTGFVSYGADSTSWYVTRLAISCCAADAVAYRVRVTGRARPARDRWVKVTGVLVPGTGLVDETGTALASTAAVDASDVVATTAPSQTYS